MQALTSPGSLVTIAGAALTVIGSIAYATDSPNLSLAGVFYGVPVLLGGLALKSSELPPAQRLTPASQYKELRQQEANEPLRKLLGDVTRWRYGQKAHLESSLEALKLWDDDAPPQLLSIAELEQNGGYGLRLRFSTGAVPYDQWEARQDRLGRFFGPGLQAELSRLGGDQIQLSLLPAAATPETTPNV
ncbi:DUF2854 domain-containing protein [Synechococcus sp. CCY9201]|uniref:DUF2854 domain-containing protein n=1 Tax=Synechococcus sp. CCY9201 TaxID=174697 RepID=UPI002B201877|nr:DUF2854 domain-containing protein [Synechococcus sp. CCY9201]MEA5474384.1 DUF2854 domain-containing protein [Synechococcus sp. CCY9201]